MKKVAFIVEPNFDKLHFGVRNFFSTVKDVLSEDNITDFVMFLSDNHEVSWYRIVLDIQSEVNENSNYMSYERGKNLPFTYGEYLQFEKRQDKRKIKTKYYFQYIGRSLEKEGYDICIITNPWLMRSGIELHAGKIYGFVYDFIANMFVLTKKDKPLDWANLHRIGYECYNNLCDYIVGDSESVAEQYAEYYPQIDRGRIKYFAPFIPYQYRSVQYSGERKENAVILAAPFDIRKGIKLIPGLLNSLIDSLDVLYIYGQPRCSSVDFDDFFGKLNVKRIRFYPYASYSELIRLYQKSKFLLFPSTQEGLGIPLLESQVCGCRIVTTDEAPMNTLGVEGAYFLTGNMDKDSAIMNEMLRDELFNYAELSRKAARRFAVSNVLSVF